ncbi:hypothetical protein FZ103_02260 [Streptomonospora sp. PA3]|uniref:VanZ family protein n=1 Tax=Streptomonospora sp. PA3 TaxID=2607326 RepID=UPI0012DE08A9|nr:VanZ family protein [Streptomonospora sp. PA3]MUL40010.1 hypothetical protein [Streptomonospora sp. PA3]
MGGLLAVDAAAHGAACAAALTAAAMAFLRRQHRRFGRLAGWPGRVTAAVMAAAGGLAVFAVYPLPSGTAACAGGGAAPEPAPLALLGDLGWPPGGAGAAHAAAAAAALVPVGLLLSYRYRRGVLPTVGLCAALATGVEVLHLTGLLGAYACPYRVAAADDVLLGACGGLAGWLLGRAARRVLPRAWPGAVADLMPPGGVRRLLARTLDTAVCWFGACTLAAAAAPWAERYAAAASEERLRAAALIALALVFGALVPMLRRDRATPGQAACYLALATTGRRESAARPRALLRQALVAVPVTALLAAGLGWWVPAAAVLHGSCALVRRDRAGLFDLIARTRVRTRSAVTGGLPDELVRYTAPPPVPAGAVPAQR